MKKRRNTTKDGLKNKLEAFALTNFKWFWNSVQSNEYLQLQINKFLINSAIYKTKTRPYPLSTMGDYTSWDSLTDRTYSGRHLPPYKKPPENLPSIDEVTKLFFRTGKAKLSSKSTLLFPYFAQWFTDGFLRTDQTNNLKNTSNHEIDVSPLYGLKKEFTDILRSHVGGKLKSQFINNEEYPLFYYQNGVVKDEFKNLPIAEKANSVEPAKKDKLFAMGKETSNVQIGYVMMNTLFLREHNRICKLLVEEYKDWNDERLFQTARNIVIVLLIKIVIQEYINHITPYHFNFVANPTLFTNEKWYRQNWMSLEFNLLYRWHSLIPDVAWIENQEVPMSETLWNNDIVINKGLGRLFEDASLQPAGQIGLFNTPPFLIETEKKSIQLGRDAKLASYNEYREICQFGKLTDFDQITEDESVQNELRRLYGHVDNIEFYVGLFAEDPRGNSALSPLIGRLVGIDAFSQALTNPLLAENVFKPETFSQIGWEIINTTQNLSDILHRNIPPTDKPFKVTMTQGK